MRSLCFSLKEVSKRRVLHCEKFLVGYLVNTDQDDWSENAVEIIRALLKLMDKVQGMLPERTVGEAGDISDQGRYYPERHEDSFDDGYEG